MTVRDLRPAEILPNTRPTGRAASASKQRGSWGLRTPASPSTSSHPSRLPRREGSTPSSHWIAVDGWRRVDPPMHDFVCSPRRGHRHDDFDFLGFRTQCQPKRGSENPTVYTYPTNTALCSVKAKVRGDLAVSQPPLAVLLDRLAPILRAGPTTSDTAFPSRPSTTCDHLASGTSLDPRQNRRATGGGCYAATCPGGGPRDGKVALFDLAKVAATRLQAPGPTSRPRGQQPAKPIHRRGLAESRMLGNGHVRFGGRPGATDRRRPTPRQADPTQERLNR